MDDTGQRDKEMHDASDIVIRDSKGKVIKPKSLLTIKDIEPMLYLGPVRARLDRLRSKHGTSNVYCHKLRAAMLLCDGSIGLFHFATAGSRVVDACPLKEEDD